MLDPSKLSFARQVDYLHVGQFSGLATLMSVAGGAAPATDAGIGLATDGGNFALTKTSATACTSQDIPVRRVSAVSPTAYLSEIGTSGQVGLLIAAGEAIRTLFRIPNCWDRRHPLNLRAHWTSGSNDDSDSVLWTIKYFQVAPEIGSVAGTFLALNTAVPDDPCVGRALDEQVTENGVLNAGTLVDASRHIALEVAATTLTGITEALHLLGLEIEYTPRFGVRHNRDEAAIWVP